TSARGPFFEFGSRASVRIYPDNSDALPGSPATLCRARKAQSQSSPGCFNRPDQPRLPRLVPSPPIPLHLVFGRRFRMRIAPARRQQPALRDGLVRLYLLFVVQALACPGAPRQPETITTTRSLISIRKPHGPDKSGTTNCLLFRASACPGCASFLRRFLD